MATVAIDLAPTPGFCVKSSTLQPAVHTAHSSNAGANLLIPMGMKLFINIAWDTNVPPPPPASEQVIARAMRGEDPHGHPQDAWYVPVVVSDGRADKDKAGNPSLVFDCVYNTAIKSRILRDPQFKPFVIELALQRIEAQSNLLLSRNISTPNIAAKGKLTPRRVLIPAALLNPDGQQKITPQPNPAPPLIQEIPQEKPKGILKHANAKQPPKGKLVWSWLKQNDNLVITIDIPPMTREAIAQATLDLEPRRLLLQIPNHPLLDIDLNLSDAEIVSNAQVNGGSVLAGEGEEARSKEPSRTLLLKRQRDFNVDRAEAEWRVQEGILVVVC